MRALIVMKVKKKVCSLLLDFVFGCKRNSKRVTGINCREDFRKENKKTEISFTYNFRVKCKGRGYELFTFFHEFKSKILKSAKYWKEDSSLQLM